MNDYSRGEVIKTLDMMGCSLSDHGHHWTDEERQSYESAILHVSKGSPLPQVRDCGLVEEGHRKKEAWYKVEKSDLLKVGSAFAAVATVWASAMTGSLVIFYASSAAAVALLYWASD